MFYNGSSTKARHTGANAVGRHCRPSKTKADVTAVVSAFVFDGRHSLTMFARVLRALQVINDMNSYSLHSAVVTM